MSTPGNPFVECTGLAEAQSMLKQGAFLREQPYGCGWTHCQLPGPLGVLGMDPWQVQIPTVLEGGPSHLWIYHQCLMAGSTSVIALLPETDIVVAILPDASPLGDAVDCMSQTIIEELFEPPVRHEHEHLAEEVACGFTDLFPSMGRTLEKNRTPGTMPTYPLNAYTGTSIHEFIALKIVIALKNDSLTLSFQGLDAEAYNMRQYHHGTPSWWMTRNEASRRTRIVQAYLAETYLVHFQGADRMLWTPEGPGSTTHI